ncbi:ARM repeat-containing protein, partial [Hesseltinella vesiculosa]
SDESVFSEGDEDVSMDEDDDIESESDDNEPSETEDQHEPAKDEEQTVAASALPATSKYVPPHLRKMATTKSEQQIRLQRQLQGLLNKLSESNMEMILVDIEKLYGVYPRHDVNTTVTELILTSISQKANLLDSFVILYATIVASLYRLIGIEFAAHFVQTLVESFEKYYKQSQEAIERGDEVGEDGPVGTREARNLLTLILELYNFQVVACILVYDLIRSLIGQMHEQSVELLLKIVRTCGAQMRTDDPASLKDVIDAIQKESAKRDPKTISVRHKFMLETLTNIKNNKIKSSEVSARQADKDMVVKMKKFLTGLTKKRATRSAEPLRVSLEDIHEIETKGKWWLVGASWRANLVGTESEHAKKKQDTKVASDLKKDQSMQQTLLKLARKQGMNTDVRRSIFVSLMGAEDYVDAYEKLNKLGLSEVQQREIPRVILQCSGNEKTFNPYYVFVSERMCQLNHSYKVTFQYCLWDFLRDLGLQDIGGLERTSSSGSEVRLNRIVNLGKFFGMLFAKQTLSLSILRTINFISLTQKAQVFLDIVFSHMLLQLK